MTQLRDPFEILEPPPGGLVGLRRRLHDSETRTRRRAIAVSAGIAVAAAVCIALLATVDAPPPAERAEIPEPLRSNPTAIALGIADDLTEPVVAVGGTAAMRVPTGDDDVVFYMVGAAPGSAPEPEPAAEVTPPSPTPASDPASSEPASPR